MERIERHQVIGRDGLRGWIVEQASAHEGQGAQVLVQLEDGRQVLVARDALSLQPDGSYTLALSSSDFDAAQGGDEIVIPVIEEELRVGKRVVVSDGVRVTKRVSSREELVDEPLLREELEVERIAVNSVVDAPSAPRQEGDTLIVPLFEEVLVVEKRLVLREELHITRRAQTVREPQRVMLRREEVVVEQLDVQEQHTKQGSDSSVASQLDDDPRN